MEIFFSDGCYNKTKPSYTALTLPLLKRLSGIGWLIHNSHADVAANSTPMVVVFVGWSRKQSTIQCHYSYVHEATAA